ncbi:Concanavalin A-like lectin/glucanase, subgroup, partial [Cynara cardunculus var. scolymus]
MQQHVASTLKLCILVIFFLFLKQSFCLDPTSYEVCAPKPCGHDGRSINFPFFTPGPRASLCGYPGFEVHCYDNGSLVLPISGNDYLVKDIHYSNSSMRLVTAQNVTCPSGLTNITLDPYRFRLFNDSVTRELVFLMNCSKELPENLSRYRIGSCNPNILLVMLSDDRNLEMGKEVCGHLVVAPVQVHYDYAGIGRQQMEVVDGGNYAQVMMKGFMMQWVAPYCTECKQSGGRCGSNGYNLQCFCPWGDQMHAISCPTREYGTDPGMLLVLVGIGLISLVITLIRKLKRRRKTNVNVENFLKNHEFLDPKRYTYSQIKKMTNSFEINLGQGGFGCVYKGKLSNGNLVAVKVLNELKGNGEDFVNEVASVGKTCHVNIVSLVGFCSEGHQRALIYEFMPNGSLERFIYGQTSSNNNQLGWEKLFQIAIGIARGLEYLHSGCST